MRPHSSRALLRAASTGTRTTPSSSITPRCLRLQQQQRRYENTLPPDSHFADRPSRFRRYVDEPDDMANWRGRNPMNYVENRMIYQRRRKHYTTKMWFNGAGIAAGLLFQIWLVLSFAEFEDEDNSTTVEGDAAKVNATRNSQQRLDSSNPALNNAADAPVRVIQAKPGDPTKMIDNEGNELVPTGTSTIPHFPRTILIPSTSAEPSAQPTSSTPGHSVVENAEEYSLLGLGIRTVSFLSIQVYVLGMYVRTSDLDKLNAAFVRLVNPLGSSLIPSEKESLRKDLMGEEKSLQIWDQILKENGVRSAVRIVPTRGTDFGHLRDGWVTGITNRTREASRSTEGKSEWDAPGFGESIGSMKQLLTGKGKAPKGSTVLLTRDERGVMRVLFEKEKKVDERGMLVGRSNPETIGSVEDERISRQIWMGYLGGKNVSSEGARKSIVDGVMELVERPVGTVGNQVV